jgi:hypothetical protein
MADIENLANPQAVQAALSEMDDGHLTAQSLVQQGAIHAVSFLLANGCNEESATQMLHSLRDSAAAVRKEVARRGMHEPFPADQTAFH